MTTIDRTATTTGAPAGQELALAIADRLLDTDPIIAAAGPAATSLSRGLAGTALLHARLATLHARYAEAAGRHWTRAVQLNIAYPCRSGGIFNGAGALAASLILGIPYLPDPDPYRATVRRGVDWLSARAVTIAAWQTARRVGGAAGTPWQTYDLINGLSGIGAMLLAAVRAGHTDAEYGLAATCDALINMITVPAGERPGWWRPTPENPAALADPHNRDAANTGLAHGIAGPLAFLAACHLTGHVAIGQAEAIRAAANWLRSWRDGDSWPPQITAEDLAGTSTAPSTRGRRDAWCYGAAGIGAALLAAGRALADPDLTEEGRHAIDALAKREWDTEGPTLCHGTAGVLLCAQSAGSPATSDRAAAALSAHCTSTLPFFFRHHDHGEATDEPGLLVGAAGIALTLADRCGLPAPPVTSPWSAALLMPLAVSLPARPHDQE